MEPEPDKPSDPAELIQERYEVPPQSIHLYGRVWQFETWLRQMVYVELKSARGLDWAAQIQGFEANKEKDKRLTHMNTPHESPLAYKTLGDLWEIIKKVDNWRLFETYFPPKNLLEAKLAEVLQIRHRVAHCRSPHRDDLRRFEQFLRDIDKGFWRFCTSYNKSSPITPVETDSLALKFAAYDQFPWTRVEENAWARVGIRDPSARFNLTIEYLVRPWVDTSSLANPPAPGVLYHVYFVAFDHQTFDYSRLLTRTRHLHHRVIHIALCSSCSSLGLTIPSILAADLINETIEEFREEAYRSLDALPIDRAGYAKRVADNWPEYVLAPSNPLTFLDPSMSCSFFRG